MATAEEYRTGATNLYDQSIAELDAGDLRQASEKLWGAAAQALKAVAERRGWEHDAHAHFYRIIRELQEEAPSPELRSRFDTANVLHINFYEDWLNESEVRERSNDVRLLIEQLERI